MASIENKVKELIEPIIIELGYSLYDVIYEKEGKDFYLRVFIDSEKGISIDDCENVNNAITDKLDEKDIIKEMYFLEVSSCGLERVLRTDEHLKNQLENEINVKLYKTLEGKKEYTGILKKFDDKFITIKTDEKELEINRKDISQLKTIYNWK